MLPNITAEVVAARLEQLFDACPGVAAVRDGQLVGFLGWFTIEDFRSTGQPATYCPVWGHSAVPEHRQEIYRQLYQAASREWVRTGSPAHAITVFTHDTDAAHAMFWNGFGISVVDAVRAIDASDEGTASRPVRTGVAIRRATPADVDLLADLESEHWRHYTQPPILVPAQGPDLDEVSTTLNDRIASYWLAETADQPIGFLRFEPVAPGAADIFHSDTTIAISGAFVRPSHRGRGAASALVGAALDGYRQAGFTSCVMDFESFNPDARSFWPRTFRPVCLSLVRRPEAMLVTNG